MGEGLRPEENLESCGESCSPKSRTSQQSWPEATWRDRPRLRELMRPERVERRMDQLVGTIEHEVIPRMLLAQRASAEEISTDLQAPLSQAEECVEEFASLLLEQEIEVAYAYIDSVRVRGVPLSTIYLELLAPAARRLGQLWEDDRCAFADVTVALCRLHEILRGLSVGHEVVTDAPPLGRRVLLVPMPGEQHTFGLLMVGDFFRRAGWDVVSESLNSNNDLVGLLSHEWFTLVGVSVSCETRLGGLAPMIHSLRKAARNRSLGVMVGGALFAKQPELALQVGADATGKDARQAALQAERLVNMLSSHC